ncbi:unnamed protein product [Rotaria sp. Silwood2]|nr:unnamed protein product [Rotaria sp. Silwood2]CAF2727423.1 unnamed protein product [Rotaria sp. Silwood2]CAF2961352.1 unnamed protein product [Rotaria sp. Silwood2]CAF3137112.1 unnamed protein product [Rotaria sp. Silwood2]CAF4036692.1 unnamed protein product [Rotaria sp. Silwood2]
MSLYSISTAEWSIIGSYGVGLFQTCGTSQCIKNQYESINNETYSPPIFVKRFFNAAPLAIVGVFIQLVACFFCLFTAFISLPSKSSITCYITPLLIFIAFLFQLSTIVEASHGIHLNGRSSMVFEAALVLQVVAIVLAIMAADRIHIITNVQCV